MCEHSALCEATSLCEKCFDREEDSQLSDAATPKRRKKTGGRKRSLLSPAEKKVHNNKLRRESTRRCKAANELRVNALELSVPILQDAVRQLGIKLAAAESENLLLTQERDCLQLQVNACSAYVGERLNQVIEIIRYTTNNNGLIMTCLNGERLCFFADGERREVG